MKPVIARLIHSALDTLQQRGDLPADLTLDLPEVERARDRAHGDLASNCAMKLARHARCKPRDLAERIVAALPQDALIERVEIAGPGFINFYLNDTGYHQVLEQILTQGADFGRNDSGAGQRIQIEFVSANPTGPLHVGHGRGAAYGATLANLLRANGYCVECEYYVNDAGRQMHILATSAWLRYAQMHLDNLPFPDNGYRGEYLLAIAEALHAEYGTALVHPREAILHGLPTDAHAGGDREQYIDAMIARCQTLLGEANYRAVFQRTLQAILNDIRADLADFGVEFDRWYSEQSLMDSGALTRAVDHLRHHGHLYTQEGAEWFASKALDDEKDRVVRRENGQYTYFASDIAYHADKYQRGFDHLINIWGADHHGYIARVRAALRASDLDAERLEILLVQFVNLLREGAPVSMSTRSGEFITLRQLREDVGRDAARFFYVLRRSEQHLDFDLDLARSQTRDNPVYYIQYAHARICSVLREATQRTSAAHSTLPDWSKLEYDIERDLMVALSRYPETVRHAGRDREPHQIAHYLKDLAGTLHAYYDHRPMIPLLDDDPALRTTRLGLCRAVRQVLVNGLALLGVSAPEAM